MTLMASRTWSRITWDTWELAVEAAAERLGASAGGWPLALASQDLRVHQAASLFARARWPSLDEWARRWGWSRGRVLALVRRVGDWGEPSLSDSWAAWYHSEVRRRSGWVVSGGRRPAAPPGHQRSPAPRGELVDALRELLGHGLIARDLAGLEARDEALVTAIHAILLARGAWPGGERRARLRTLLRQLVAHERPAVRDDGPSLHELAGLAERARSPAPPPTPARAPRPARRNGHWLTLGGGADTDERVGAAEGDALAERLAAGDRHARVAVDAIADRVQRNIGTARDVAAVRQLALHGFDLHAWAPATDDPQATEQGRQLGLCLTVQLEGYDGVDSALAAVRELIVRARTGVDARDAAMIAELAELSGHGWDRLDELADPLRELVARRG